MLNELKVNTDSRSLRKLANLKLVVLFVIAMIIVLLNTQAAITNYYVGGKGASDNNPGTSIHPFATIQKAASVAVEGDIINIRKGIYRETIVPANSGTPGNPIVYQPDVNAVVTVSGADIADGGWSLHSGNIYKKTILMTNGYNANMTDNLTLMANQVFVNGKMMIEARWPNLPKADDLFNRNDFRDGNKGSWSTADLQTLADEGVPDIPGGWTGGTIWVNGWFLTQTRTITAHAGTQIFMSGKIIGNEFRKYYYLTGRLGALDTEKEFFYDGAQLYLWQPGGESPANVEVKKRNYAFDLSGKSNITIRKVSLFAATIITNTGSTNITLDELNAKYINHDVTVAGRDLVYSHTGQTVADFGATGIRLMGCGSIIKNSEVAFSSNMGIMLGNNCTAHNNTVHDIAYDGTYASAIAPAMGTNGQSITNNTLYRVGRSCIDLTNSQNVSIGYNNMYEYGMINCDLGAIYSCRDANLTGTRIHHNWIHDHKATNETVGINTGLYFDQNSGPVQMDHNVIWFPDGGTRTGDIYVQHGSDNEETERVHSHLICNNTLASTNNVYTYNNWRQPEQALQVDIMKNNIYQDSYFTQWLPATPVGSNYLTQETNPIFVNIGFGGLIYRIGSNSPAKDTGVVISGITDGYAGSAPDIGAYEYGRKDWVPGYNAPVGTTRTPDTND